MRPTGSAGPTATTSGYREMIDHLRSLGFRPALFIPGDFNRRTARLIAMDGVFARGG